MKEVIANAISSYTYIEVVFLIIVVFMLYMIYLKFTDDDYYSDVQDIKNKYKARMWEYLSGELRVVEAQSLNAVEEIFGINGETETPHEIQMQFSMFSLVLERTLHHTVFEAIKTAIRINGFIDMNDEELVTYVKDKSNVFLRESRKSINNRILYYPKLRGTEEQRFTLDDSIKLYDKVVRKYKRLHAKEKEELAELKKTYSLWYKINFIGAFFRAKKADK